MDIKIKEMTAPEFYKVNSKAQYKSFTPFAEFHQSLSGYDLFKQDKPIDKWDAYISGYNNAGDVLGGKSKVKAVLRPIEDETLKN